ncbi:MAG: hypothetical protein V1673_06250 [Candidatus Omnitrophota bacterium]
MKKKCLSVVVAVCVFGTFPGLSNCQCVGADCGSVPKAIQAKVPQCHSAASQAGGEGPSHKECCGKCRIEKAAVLSSEFSLTGDVRHGNTLAEVRSFADFHSKIRNPSFFQGKFFESPPGFFEQHVLNTTFSFRAPPQVHVL